MTRWTIYRDIEARAGDVPPSVIEGEARRWVEGERLRWTPGYAAQGPADVLAVIGAMVIGPCSWDGTSLRGADPVLLIAGAHLTLHQHSVEIYRGVLGW